MAIRQTITKNGAVAGVACGDPRITVFKSLPFAAPPVGELRWRPPQPVKDWEGVYDASRFKPIAAQSRNDHRFYMHEFYQQEEPMDEDCLYLDVYTPAKSAEERLPVLFFIHGGGYSTGYSYEMETDGEAICKRGVIYVSINYRLGVLGYLAHQELTAESGYGGSGNYGLLDQIAALKWVRENIAAFGGDPDNITIFGQSAGAFSVLNLVTSPLTEGMIAKAIMQSGGGYSGNTGLGIGLRPLAEAEEYGALLLKKLGAANIEEARKLPYETVLRAAEMLPVEGLLQFAPVLDGYAQVESTARMIETRQYANIPYIIGCNANENSSYHCVPEIRVSPEAFQKAAAACYGDQAEAFLKACHFDEDPEAAASHYPMNDSLMPATFAWSKLAAKRTGLKPTYMYYFDRQLPGENGDAFHSAELWYVFQTVGRCWRPMNGVDFDLANTVCSYWCNFAKTGDPNGEGLPVWTPYTEENQSVMELGANVGMMPEPISERMQFLLDRVFSSYQEK